MSELPVYATAVRFYRAVLGVAYETGSRLGKLGILTPDAICDDGRPLYRLNPESIQKARESIRSYRARLSRTRHNLPVSLCSKKPLKTVTA